jgi:hypothetical protein
LCEQNRAVASAETQLLRAAGKKGIMFHAKALSRERELSPSRLRAFAPSRLRAFAPSREILLVSSEEKRGFTQSTKDSACALSLALWVKHQSRRTRECLRR